MITLTGNNFHWLGKAPEAQSQDQCAHGNVECRVNNTEFVNSDCNLPATGLFLLRTLESDHSETNSVTEGINLLFAHCGHGIFASQKSKYGFVITGCNQVADPKIIHDGTYVIIKSKNGAEEKVKVAEWRKTL